MQKLIVFASVLVSSLFSCASSVYEFAFTNTDVFAYSEAGIPIGWELTGDGTVSMLNPQPQTIDGEAGLGFAFGSADGTNILRKVDSVFKKGEIDSDYIFVNARILIQQEFFRSDLFQFVISTNNWETYEPIGEPIMLEEVGRTVNEWKSISRGARISGATQHDVYFGVLAGSGWMTMHSGYLQSVRISSVSIATPKSVVFQVDGEASALEPGTSNALVAATVEAYPSDKVTVLNVFCQLERNDVVTDMPMTRVGSSNRWQTDFITPAIDAGESIRASICTEYVSEIASLGEDTGRVAGDGKRIVSELSSPTNVVCGKLGSVWINEFTLERVELCGTTNRVLLSSEKSAQLKDWSLELSKEVIVNDDDLTYTTNIIFCAALPRTFNFTTNMVNGVVGLETRELVWTSNSVAVALGAIPEGEYVLRLLNAAGIEEQRESVPLPFPNSTASMGKTGTATWPRAGYGYDWSSTATNDVFKWSSLSETSFGTVNKDQGFKVPVSVTLVVNTETQSGDGVVPLSYASVVAKAYGVANDSDNVSPISYISQSVDGVVTTNITGYSSTPSTISIQLSAEAFGWYCAPTNIIVQDESVITNSLLLTPTVASDDFIGPELNSYWKNTGDDGLAWQLVQEPDENGVLQFDSTMSDRGVVVLDCSNYLSPCGSKYAAVSFKVKNFESSSSNKDRFRVDLVAYTADGPKTNATPVLESNRSPRYGHNEWYSYLAVFEMTDEFMCSDEIWCRIICDTDGFTMAYTTLDNLRIAFQDVAMPTNLVRSVEQPASGERVSFDLDVIPQTTGTVSEVSADLYLVLNGVTNVVPFAFMTNDTFTSEMFADDYTNAIPLVVEDGETKAAKLTISPEALEAALGKSLGLNRPFLVGDEVTYFAAVRYNSDNGATTPDELYETRYFPDNSTTSNIDERAYWIVEGDYGVNTNLEAYSFTVAGPALSKFGEVIPTTEGVKFNLHGYDPNGISSLTINLNGRDYAPFEGLATNAQVRVTGTWELPTGLAPNTDYTVTINAKDANGNDLTAATFDFTTLPVLNSATISAVATNAVELTVSGTAAGYVVPTGWVSSGANTWRWSVTTPNANVTWESVPVYGTNKLGKASETVYATPTSLYTLAAPARTAPVVSNVVTTVTVQADRAHNDGNSEFTLYGLRITSSDVNDTPKYATTNGVEVWKTLTAWKSDAPLELAEPVINLSVTNYYSFVARNNDGVEAADGALVTTNWFGMTTGFVGDGQQATTPFGADHPRGSVAFTLEAFDPARSAQATNVVWCEIGTNVWIHAYPVQFTDLTITNNFVWDAWKDVTDRFGEVPWLTNYTLRATVTDGKRASAEQEISGWLDFAPPANLAIRGAPEEGTAVNTTSYDITFSATETNALGYNWELTGTSGTTVTKGTGSSASITELVDGDYALSVTATDIMGNDSETNRHWTVDTTPPTVTRFETTTPSHFNATKVPMVVTVEFSEPVTGFAADDVAVNNCTVSAVEGSGAAYTFEVRPAADGEVSVQIKAKAVVDRAGNGNVASTTLTRMYDTVRPTVTRFETTTPEYFNAKAAPMLVTVAFREPVAGFTTNEVTVANGVATNVVQDADAYVVAIAPLADGPIAVQIAENAVIDLAGNGNVASATLTRTYDNTIPQVLAVVGTPWNGCVTNLAAYSLSATASDAITDAGKLVFHWSVNDTPANTAGNTLADTVSADGPYTVSVYVTDEAGNDSAAASYRWTLDWQPPAGLEITGDPAAPGPDGRLVVTNGTGFAFEAINATDAHLPLTYRWATNGVDAAATSAAFSANDAMEGTNTVSVWAIDAAGNESLTPASRTWVVDLTPPTEPQVSGVPENGLTNVEAFELTATAEDATALAYHWTLNGVAVDERSSTYFGTAVEGTNTVSVFATDEAGNVSPTNTVRWVLDTHGPTVELSTETPGSPYVFNDYHVFKVRVEFNEPVVNFTTNSVTVHNGTVTNVVPVEGSDVAYEVMIRPLTDGEVRVQVENNKVTDHAGNWNDASESLTRTCDITHPKVTIADADGESGPIDAEITEWYVLVRFDEGVQNFNAGDVTVDIGNVARVFTLTANQEYKVKITFDGAYNGPLSVQVDADKVTDFAGNGNVASKPLTRYHGDLSGDVEFGGGVCVKVDPVTGTNSVSFTAVDFSPDATSTFTLSRFAASTQGSEFQMWFVVCDTLGGETRHVPVEFKKFESESGELTVTLPAAATTGRNTFFILGVDNKGE